MVEIALALALLASFFFSSRDVSVRKSLVKADLYSSLVITLLFAIPISGVIALLTGEIWQLTTLDPIVIQLFATVGILQFVFTRGLYYAGIGILGASRAIAIVKMDSALAVLLAVLFIGEGITLLIAISVIVVMAGVFLVSFSESSGQQKEGTAVMRQKFYRGLMYLILGATGSAVLPLMIRVSLLQSGVPVLGIFIASSFALMVLAPLSLVGRFRNRLLGLDRNSIKFITYSSIFATSGQIAKFVALGLAPVVFVAPILNANILITFFLAYLFIRRQELVNSKVIVGGLLVVVGITVLALIG